MFKFLRGRNDKDPVKACTNQTIGGQSYLFRLFKEAFNCTESEIDKIELTYFAVTVMSVTYLAKGVGAEKEKTVDEFSMLVLEKSLPNSNKPISLQQAVQQLQIRYQEYAALITPVLVGKKPEKSDPSTTLMMHFYECVMNSSTQSKMIDIAAQSGLMTQYIANHFDFIETEL